MSLRTSPHGLRLFVFLIVLFISRSSPPAVAAEQSIVRGAAIANACATCHGPDGQSQGAIPSINSLAKENFVAAMRAFRTGERPGTVMNRIAKGLDEKDIAAVAAYWGGRPPAAKSLH